MSEKQARYTLYGGDVVLEFNEDEHVYRVEGLKVPSTTQITKVIEKSILLPWATKTAAEWLETQWLPGRAYTYEAIESILKRSKIQYKIKSDEATTIGSQAHGWIETFGNAVLATGEKWPEGWKEIPLPHTLDGIHSVNAFLNWYDEHDVVIVACERKVYSKTHNYSGTFDLLAYVNGTLTVVDFKTSKAIYEDYYIQGAAYITAYCEELDYLKSEDPRPQDFMVLRIPKDGSPYETGTFFVSSPMFEAYFDIFKASRVIYNWQEKYTETWQSASMKPVLMKGKKKDITKYLPYI